MATSRLQTTALGMVETRGLVASIEAADAMSKVAYVRLVCQEEIGGGYITIMVRGEVGAVQSAVLVGIMAVRGQSVWPILGGGLAGLCMHFMYAHALAAGASKSPPAAAKGAP